MEQHDEKNYSKALALYRIDTAEDDLKVACDLYEENRLRFANNRAYYSIFHAITAIYALDGSQYRKHKDAIANFNKNYIHAGVFPRVYGRKIAEAEEIRHASDYDDFYIASKEETEELITTARELLTLIKEYVDNKKK